MSIEYPIYRSTGVDLIVIINPVLAYRYRDFKYINLKGASFDFQEYTTRKMVTKFENSGEEITLQQFTQFLMGGIGKKLRTCMNAILKTNPLMSKEDEKVIEALKYTTYIPSKYPHAI